MLMGERKMALNATRKKKQFNMTLDTTCKKPVENVTSSKTAHDEKSREKRNLTLVVSLIQTFYETCSGNLFNALQWLMYM
mgnify:FL=1